MKNHPIAVNLNTSTIHPPIQKIGSALHALLALRAWVTLFGRAF
jgi:hypothetical protein